MTEKRERNHSLGRQSPVQKSYESVGDGWAPDGHARKKKKRTGRCCDTRHTSYQVHTYLVMSLLSFESRGTSRENQAKETRKRKVQSKKQQGREKKKQNRKKESRRCVARMLQVFQLHRRLQDYPFRASCGCTRPSSFWPGHSRASLSLSLFPTFNAHAPLFSVSVAGKLELL